MSKPNARSRRRSKNNRRPCDVVVLGGGPAGAAAAIMLARAGRSVAVLEKSRYDQPRIGETLGPAARLPLARLGVWDQFVGAGHAASPGILSVWGEDSVFENHFIFNPYGHGWHLDRRRFDEMLAGAARQAGARLWCGVALTSCTPTVVESRPDGWQIEFTDGRHRHQLHPTFVIDATGRMAVLARRQGAHRIASDRLVGLVVVLGTDMLNDEHDGRTLVEAAEEGWWYSARLPGSQFIAAYMTDADLLPRRRESWPDFWRTRLQSTTDTKRQLRSSVEPAGTRVIAANGSRLDRTSGPGWLAAGDAALAFDPLSSQGMLQALISGIRAAEVLQRCLAGETEAKSEYDRDVHQTFREYARLHAHYYGRERRWPESVFWHRRRRTATGEAHPVGV